MYVAARAKKGLDDGRGGRVTGPENDTPRGGGSAEHNLRVASRAISQRHKSGIVVEKVICSGASTQASPRCLRDWALGSRQ